MHDTGINGFPPEILDHILHNVEQPVPASVYFPQFPLTPLARVCRTWQPLVERRLYRAVALGSTLSSFTNFYHADIDALPKQDRAIAYLAMYNDPRCRARGGEVFVRQFREAVEGSPRLGKLVRTLRLKGRIAREDKDRVEDIVAILRLCSDVVHVELQDCHYPAPLRSPLLDALKGCQALTSLTVRNADASNAVRVLGTTDFLCAAPAWPRLRRLEVSVPRQPASADSIDEHIPDLTIDPTSLQPNCCPHLQSVVLPRARLRGPHLRLLHRITGPNLTRVDAVVSADAATLAALHDCLKAWAPALRVLRLHFAAQPAPAVIVDALPAFRLLEDLAISSSPRARGAIVPTQSEAEEDKQRQQKQEKDAWMGIIRAVADALADPRQLPCIRRLAILFKGIHDPELIVTEKHLDELCAPREISMLW